MDFIRSENVLRLLLDLALLVRRKQFGADRRVDDVLQNRLHLRQPFCADPRDDRAHQRLRDGTVHAVLRDMVAVERAPSQRDFRQIACSDN